jgi:uncharacterized protein with HEPN domain
MPDDVQRRLDDILGAIMRVRVADRRRRLARSLADDTGVQIAFQAVQYNLAIIGDAVHALPVEVLEREPATPWGELAARRDVGAHDVEPVVPAVVPQGEFDLDALEEAVLRLRSAR